MTPEQRDVHDEVVSGVRGQLVGPLRAVIHSPDLARRWSRLGSICGSRPALPEAERARDHRHRQTLEQPARSFISMPGGKGRGPRSRLHRSDQAAQVPVFADEPEVEVYEFARMLQQAGSVDAGACRRDGALGRRGVSS
jgi:4-carboxymuconolactone decarboxylase